MHIYMHAGGGRAPCSWPACTGLCSAGQKGAGDSAHEVPVGGHSQLEGAEADVIDGLVVDAGCLVGVLHQLVDGQHGVVGLHYCV